MALRDLFNRNRGGTDPGRRWYEFWKPKPETPTAKPYQGMNDLMEQDPESAEYVSSWISNVIGRKPEKKWWQFWKRDKPKIIEWDRVPEPEPEPEPEPPRDPPIPEPPKPKRKPGRPKKERDPLQVEPDINQDPDADLIERYRPMIETMIEKGWIDEFKSDADMAEFLRVLSSSAWEEAHKYWYSEIAFLEIQEAIERGATARQLQDEYNKVLEKKTIGFLQAWEGWQEAMGNLGIEINDEGTGFTAKDLGFTIDDIWTSMDIMNNAESLKYEDYI